MMTPTKNTCDNVRVFSCLETNIYLYSSQRKSNGNRILLSIHVCEFYGAHGYVAFIV